MKKIAKNANFSVICTWTFHDTFWLLCGNNGWVFFFHWVSLCTLVAKKEKSIKVDHKNVFKDIDQKGTNSMLLQNSNLSFDYHHSVFSLSTLFCTHYHSIWPHHQITTTNTVATCNVDDSSAAISVNGYEDRLNTSNTGGQKAILAISEDNESAVIKYRSDQDMSSIGEYQDSKLQRLPCFGFKFQSI